MKRVKKHKSFFHNLTLAFVLFNTTNPFDFMESISIEGKTNFFEARPTQYQNASILNKSRESSFVINSDF